jgi:chromosome segregation ATPase
MSVVTQTNAEAVEERAASIRATAEAHDSPFDESIPADAARRKLDRKILETYDADHDRIRSISSRLTRIEVVFENLQRDIARLEQRQSEMLGHTEQTASAMSAIANKLNIHTEMEEYQWTVVNKANDTLATVTSALNDHLQTAGVIDTRINWLERLLIAVVCMLATVGSIWYTQYIGH